MAEAKMRTFLALLVVLLGVLACGRGAEAVETPAGPDPADEAALTDENTDAPEAADPANAVLFWDDFQDGDSEGWQVSSAWMVQQNGDLYTFSTSGEGFAWVPAGSGWKDYALKSAYYFERGVLAFNFYLSTEGRYIVVFHDEVVSLVKELSGGEQELLAQAQAPDIVRWRWLAAAVEGSHLQVYLDGALWLEAVDDDPLPGGTVGVGASDGTAAAVDNVLVNLVPGSLPEGTLQSQPAGSQVVVPELAGPLEEDLAEAADGAEPVPDENSPSLLPPASVRFTVEGAGEATIDSGQCVTTSWNVENALGVFYQSEPAAASGFSDECPFQTTTYVLEATGADGSIQEQTVTVYVNPVEEPGDEPAAGEEEEPGEEPVEEEQGQPDLVLAGVGLRTPPFYVGQSILISVTISNEGAVDARSFTVRWYPQDGPVVGCSWDTGLAAGQTRTLTCNHSYTEPAPKTWRAHVDAESEISESNENNNQRSGVIAVSEDMLSAGEDPGG